ncbi:MAG: bifunctional diaminohydroxyphosphoribosylaminopyrimidine deaminase/5-amino-6-(5-phosphoribosylamino)uracil reductase RibD [Bradymonadia bacterium]
MRRALELTREATHRTSPNPRVGCVIVKNGEIVGEGVTQAVGGRHAEPMALLDAGAQARGAELFVTLEPCCHHGRTPPCTDAIIAAGIKKVWAGVIDPNPLVAGKGISLLEAAGIETHVGLESGACAWAIAPFSRYMLHKRPWIILKAAVTLDGRIATAEGHSQWITGPEARADVHRLRAQVDGVMIGAGTARSDDPRLTVRGVPGENPQRIVLDPALSLSPEAALLGPQAIIFHGPGAEQSRVTALAATGTEMLQVDEVAPGRLDLDAVMGHLHQRGLVSIMVEGGGVLHGSLLEAGLADEARIYIAPKIIGEGRPVVALPSVATIPEGWQLDAPEISILGSDVKVAGIIQRPSSAS